MTLDQCQKLTKRFPNTKKKKINSTLSIVGSYIHSRSILKMENKRVFVLFKRVNLPSVKKNGGLSNFIEGRLLVQRRIDFPAFPAKTFPVRAKL